MRLHLPDHRQQKDYDCGRAVIQTVCGYWNKPLPLFIANLTNAAVGLSPDTLSAAFRSLDFFVLEGNWTVGLLKAATTDGKPVIALTQLDGVGHWVTVAGVERGRVYFNCPTYGATSQKVTDWDKLWIDFHHSGGTFDRWAVCPFLED